MPGVVWVALIVAILVFVDILLAEVRRIVREVGKIRRRIAAYRELPVLSLAASVPADVNRLGDALAAFPPLLSRAEAALGLRK